MDFASAKILYTRDEIHTYVYSLWKTDLFRKAHSAITTVENGVEFVSVERNRFIYTIVDRFADLPRFFFSMTDRMNEHAHFSTWWGGIPYRAYSNPYIHDLYLIHEMAHAGEMVYVSGMNFDNFLRKMTDNELYASCVSEVQAYLELPELREKSFQHPIYADKFLNDADFVKRYHADPRRTFEEIKVVRRNTMMNANASNVTDLWIHRFYNQNAAWGACWAHSYNHVEQAMVNLRNSSRRDRKVAMNIFMKWLDMWTDKGTQVPFFTEAKAFAGVYWANREHYDKAVVSI